VDIYYLTQKGKALAGSTRSPRTPEWEVIMFLSKHNGATREQIQSYVSGASSTVIARLRVQGIISNGE
jgi:hypothetical protein